MVNLKIEIVSASNKPELAFQTVKRENECNRSRRESVESGRSGKQIYSTRQILFSLWVSLLLFSSRDFHTMQHKRPTVSAYQFVKYMRFYSV